MSLLDLPIRAPAVPIAWIPQGPLRESAGTGKLKSNFS
jgi:hypothetical protein